MLENMTILCKLLSQMFHESFRIGQVLYKKRINVTQLFYIAIFIDWHVRILRNIDFLNSLTFSIPIIQNK